MNLYVNEDPRPSGPWANQNDDFISGADTTGKPDWRCLNCNREFSTERSLGMHRHHRHPQEVNEERLATKAGRRKFWSDNEEKRLIHNANQIWHDRMTKTYLYKQLQSLFPRRSTEAIKRRLLSLEWQPEASVHDQRPTTSDVPIP